MDNTIAQIRQALLESADETTKVSGQRYFKEEVKLYGVKTATVSAMSKMFFAALKGKEKHDIFVLCEDLWQSGYLEESFIACNWSYYLHLQYEEKDMQVFERWLQEYVSNWASCDTLCNHTVGTYLDMYPARVAELKKWARSGNRWVRRGSCVSLIIPARKGKFLGEILEIATILLIDEDDLVQKGYGWMLKAASQFRPEPVFDFVMEHKDVMPRTALRYAIEKMPAGLKKEAMRR